jgi:hypothetical protein
VTVTKITAAVQKAGGSASFKRNEAK